MWRGFGPGQYLAKRKQGIDSETLGAKSNGSLREPAALENLMTGERIPVEWGGARLWLDPGRDPALLFRCLA